MGETTQSNMSARVTFLLLLAGVLSFTTSEFVPETDYSLTEAHEDAQAHINELLQEGRSDSACRNVAKNAKKEITNGQKNTQKLLNKMDVGKNCKNAGKPAMDAAKKRWTNANTAKKKANKKCNEAKSARVQVSAKSLSQFKTGCAAFLNDGKYIAAKGHMTRSCNDAVKKAAAADDARKAYYSARNAHTAAVKKCSCKAQETHAAAVKAANGFNSAANKKAWTRAQHMLCVLDGKAANKCKVPRVPRVSAPSMPNDVKKTKCSKPKPKPKKKTIFAITLRKNRRYCIDSHNHSNGRKLWLWTCNNGGAQTWQYRAAGSHGSYKQIQKVGCNRCIDNSGGSIRKGNKIQIWNCGSNNWNQQWLHSNGAFRNRKNNGYAIDLSGGKTVNGRKIQLWSWKNNNNNQKWDLKYLR